MNSDFHNAFLIFTFLKKHNAGTGIQTISYQISYLQIALSHGFKRLKAKFSICSSVNLACVEEKKLMSVITIAKVTLIFVKYVCVCSKQKAIRYCTKQRGPLKKFCASIAR